MDKVGIGSREKNKGWWSTLGFATLEAITIPRLQGTRGGWSKHWQVSTAGSCRAVGRWSLEGSVAEWGGRQLSWSTAWQGECMGVAEEVWNSMSCWCFPLANHNQKPKGKKQKRWSFWWSASPGTEQDGEDGDWIWRGKWRLTCTENFFPHALLPFFFLTLYHSVKS